MHPPSGYPAPQPSAPARKAFPIRIDTQAFSLRSSSLKKFQIFQERPCLSTAPATASGAPEVERRTAAPNLCAESDAPSCVEGCQPHRGHCVPPRHKESGLAMTEGRSLALVKAFGFRGFVRHSAGRWRRGRRRAGAPSRASRRDWCCERVRVAGVSFRGRWRAAAGEVGGGGTGGGGTTPPRGRGRAGGTRAL